jgi:hypothetical protein
VHLIVLGVHQDPAARCRCTAWNSSRRTAVGFGSDAISLMGSLFGGVGRILLRLSFELHQKGQECARQGRRKVVLRPEGIADPGSHGPIVEAFREIVGPFTHRGRCSRLDGRNVLPAFRVRPLGPRAEQRPCAERRVANPVVTVKCLENHCYVSTNLFFLLIR